MEYVATYFEVNINLQPIIKSTIQNPSAPYLNLMPILAPTPAMPQLSLHIHGESRKNARTAISEPPLARTDTAKVKLDVFACVTPRFMDLYKARRTQIDASRHGTQNGLKVVVLHTIHLFPPQKIKQKSVPKNSKV